MSLRQTFKTDKQAEIQGVVLEIGVNDHNGQPITFRLARMSQSNKRYTASLSKATRPHQAAIQNGSMDNGLARKMLQGVFIDTILLDWGNLPKSELTGNASDTELLEFNTENALALFAELPDLYDQLETQAQSAAAFREVETEVNAGNLPAS